MNNMVKIASIEPNDDIFSNMHIPEYDAKNNVTTTVGTPTKTEAQDQATNIVILSIMLVCVVLIFVVFAKMLKPQKQITTVQRPKSIQQPKQKQKEEIEEPPKQQVIQTKKSQDDCNFATPKNIEKCIRLFLETTRIK